MNLTIQHFKEQFPWIYTLCSEQTKEILNYTNNHEERIENQELHIYLVPVTHLDIDENLILSFPYKPLVQEINILIRDEYNSRDSITELAMNTKENKENVVLLSETNEKNKKGQQVNNQEMVKNGNRKDKTTILRSKIVATNIYKWIQKKKINEIQLNGTKVNNINELDTNFNKKNIVKSKLKELKFEKNISFVSNQLNKWKKKDMIEALNEQFIHLKNQIKNNESFIKKYTSDLEKLKQNISKKMNYLNNNYYNNINTRKYIFIYLTRMQEKKILIQLENIKINIMNQQIQNINLFINELSKKKDKNNKDNSMLNYQKIYNEKILKKKIKIEKCILLFKPSELILLDSNEYLTIYNKKKKIHCIIRNAIEKEKENKNQLNPPSPTRSSKPTTNNFKESINDNKMKHINVLQDIIDKCIFFFKEQLDQRIATTLKFKQKREIIKLLLINLSREEIHVGKLFNRWLAKLIYDFPTLSRSIEYSNTNEMDKKRRECINQVKSFINYYSHLVIMEYINNKCIQLSIEKINFIKDLIKECIFSQIHENISLLFPASYYVKELRKKKKTQWEDYQKSFKIVSIDKLNSFFKLGANSSKTENIEISTLSERFFKKQLNIEDNYILYKRLFHQSIIQCTLLSLMENPITIVENIIILYKVIHEEISKLILKDNERDTSSSIEDDLFFHVLIYILSHSNISFLYWRIEMVKDFVDKYTSDLAICIAYIEAAMTRMDHYYSKISVNQENAGGIDLI